MYPKGGSGSGGLPPSVTPGRCVQTGVSNECSSASGTLPRAGKGSGLVQDGWPVSSWMSSNSPEEPQGTVPRSLKGQSKGGTVSCLSVWNQERGCFKNQETKGIQDTSPSYLSSVSAVRNCEPGGLPPSGLPPSGLSPSGLPPIGLAPFTAAR